MNRQQFNITNQTRKYKIIDYIRSNGGCTKADITREFEGIISKKTIDKLVDEMIKEGIIEFKKERENSRNKKLFVKEDNPAVYVPQQLEEIETIFRKLLDKSKPHWQDISKQRLNALNELNVDSIIELFFKGPKSRVFCTDHDFTVDNRLHNHSC